MVPLNVDVYLIDKDEVHTLNVNFVAGNETVETKTQTHNQPNDGRKDYQALFNFYAGPRVLAFDVTKVETIINLIYYNGEQRH